MPRAAVSHKHLSVIYPKETEAYWNIGIFFEIKWISQPSFSSSPVWVGSLPGGQWTARVLGGAWSCPGGRLQPGWALRQGGCQHCFRILWNSSPGESYETLMQVGYKTILHLAIDEDDFNATPFVEACLKVERTSSLSSPRISGAHIFILICPIT